MGKEVENLITENNELLATKESLQSTASKFLGSEMNLYSQAIGWLIGWLTHLAP